MAHDGGPDVPDTDIRQPSFMWEVTTYAAEPLVANPCPIEVEIVIINFER
jgi:hypothetical protein